MCYDVAWGTRVRLRRTHMSLQRTVYQKADISNQDVFAWCMTACLQMTICNRPDFNRLVGT